MAVRISETSKLDGIKSWSLQALDTCPGSIAPGGGLVDACKGCYATTGMYHMPGVKAPRAENRIDWTRDEWVADMVAALRVTRKESSKYFRWFDSGDMYSVELAEKIYAVMLATPGVSHWLPTRMAKFGKFTVILAKMQALPNVMVRFSADSIDGSFVAGVHGSTIAPDAESVLPGSTLCGAYTRGGVCGGCRACYSKAVPVIAYPAHGAKMHKVIRLSVAA